MAFNTFSGQNINIGANTNCHLGNNFHGPVKISSYKLISFCLPSTLSLIKASPAQSRPLPQPSHNIPFQKDRKFIGREDILDQIQEKIGIDNLNEHNRIALVGLGGIGYGPPLDAA